MLSKTQQGAIIAMTARQLKPALGTASLTLLGLGCVIGAGIFVMTGTLAAGVAGPGLVISYLISGGFCLLIALCYGELASALPSAGSAYAYAYVSMGRMTGWVTGLLMLLAYGLATAVVAVGWSAYLASALIDMGIVVPTWLAAASGGMDVDGNAVGAGFNALAMLGIGLAVALLCFGITVTSTANIILTLFKICVVIAFIAYGAGFVRPELWSPLIPPQIPSPSPANDSNVFGEIVSAFGDLASQNRSSQFGAGGIVTAAAITFFAFIGFEMPTTAGEEAKNPRMVPIALIASVLVCITLYCGTSLVLTGIVPYTELGVPVPMVVALNAIGAPEAAKAIKWAAIAGLSTVMLTLLYAQTRVFLVMTRDGLMPPIFARLNSFGVPAIGTVATGLVVAVTAGFFEMGILSELTSVGMLGVFAIACLALIVLRVNRPQLARPFKTPLYPLTPVVGIAGCALLLPSVLRGELILPLLIFFAVGLALFFISGAQRNAARNAPSAAVVASAPRAPAHAALRRSDPLPPAPADVAASPAPPISPPMAPPPLLRPKSQPAPRVEPPSQRAPLATVAPKAAKLSDVFISYKREEKPYVEGIARTLRDLKLDVWFDAKLTPGQDFDEEINREVNSARTVLVCWSILAVQSRWVRSEASVGHKRNVLVACFLEECEPWTPFNLVHTENLSGTVLDGANPAWIKLIDQIGKQCGRPGLGAFVRLGEERAAMIDWLKTYPDDPLSADVAAWLG